MSLSNKKASVSVFLVVVIVGIIAAVILIPSDSESISANAVKSKVIIKQIEIGKGITNTTSGHEWMHNPLTDVDMNFLKKFNIVVGGVNVPVKTEIWFGPDSPSVETALSTTSVDAGYKSDVSLEVAADSIYYYYVFDGVVDLSKVSAVNPLVISFFGKQFKIVEVKPDQIIVSDKKGRTTYKNGDPYIGEKVNNEYWRWVIANLDQKAKTTVTAAGVAGGPVLAIKNFFVVDDGSDINPAPIRNTGCYAMATSQPQVRFCIKGLSVLNSDYMDLDVDIIVADLRDAGGDYSEVVNANVLRIRSNVAKTLDLGNGLKTDEIYIMRNNTVNNVPNVDVFYVNANNDVTFLKEVQGAFTVGSVNYKKSNAIDIDFSYINNKEWHLYTIAYLDVARENPWNTDGFEQVIAYIRSDTSTTWDGFGPTSNLEEQNDLTYNSSLMQAGIGVEQDDLRTQYGIIIKDPELYCEDDSMKLLIPSDDVAARVYIQQV